MRYSYLYSFPDSIDTYLICLYRRWFHAKVCIVAGVGFFTDAYDIFAINIASQMLGYVYGKGELFFSLHFGLISLNFYPGQKLNKAQDLGVKVATPVGTLVGQLLFGWLADIVGRKRMCTSIVSP